MALRVAIAVLLVAVSGSGTVAQAQISTVAIPTHHGKLRLARGAGRLEQQPGGVESGAVRFTIHHWRMQLADDSNGIYPGEEPIVVAVGTDSFRLEAGMLNSDRRGRRFTYRARKGADRGILAMTIRRESPMLYDVSFTVADVQIFPLTESAPVCMPTAVIVGDDDGFSGVNFDRPGFPKHVTPRVTVLREPCSANTWPWT